MTVAAVRNTPRIAIAAGLGLLLSTLIVSAPTKAFAATKWQRNLQQLVRKDKVRRRLMGKTCSKAKTMNLASAFCDFDGDGFVNYRENNLPLRNGKKIKISFKKADTDGDGLTDYEELLKFGTNPRVADSDHDGLLDGEEVKTYGTDPLNPDSDGNGIMDGEQYLNPGGSCGPSNFTPGGDTTQFGIPSGVTGNRTRGQGVYQTYCQVCHPNGNQGQNQTYQQIDAAITGATGKPMNIHLDSQKLADLTAFLNKTQTGGTGPCPTATPDSGTPAPTATATAIPSPTPTACPGGSLNFNEAGDTTAFGIPTPISGNRDAGQIQYNATCTACHTVQENRGADRTFGQLKSAFSTNPFMNGTITGPVILDDQQIANVIAYVHRNDTGGCSVSGTPTPVPTPNPVTQGAAIFTATCLSCHAISPQGRVAHIDRHPSLNQIHEALWTGPDEMPQYQNLTAGVVQGPPYSSTEMALWSYLNSLP